MPENILQFCHVYTVFKIITSFSYPFSLSRVHVDFLVMSFDFKSPFWFNRSPIKIKSDANRDSKFSLFKHESDFNPLLWLYWTQIYLLQQWVLKLVSTPPLWGILLSGRLVKVGAKCFTSIGKRCWIVLAEGYFLVIRPKEGGLSLGFFFMAVVLSKKLSAANTRKSESIKNMRRLRRASTHLTLPSEQIGFTVSTDGIRAWNPPRVEPAVMWRVQSPCQQFCLSDLPPVQSLPWVKPGRHGPEMRTIKLRFGRTDVKETPNHENFDWIC